MPARFEFPLELDVYKYTVDGLAERERAEAAAAGAGDAAGPSDMSMEAEPAETSGAAPPEMLHDAQQFQYSLKGIVVHSGSAFAGHYYSYIKVYIYQGYIYQG
jgi:hypothetical protein